MTSTSVTTTSAPTEGVRPMRSIERELTIQAPPDRVFEYVADLTRHPEWAVVPMQIVAVTPGTVGVGARFDHSARMMGAQRDSVTVTAYEPPVRLEFQSDGKAGLLEHWFTLERAGDGTTLRKGLHVLRPSLMTRLMAPMVMRQSAKFIEKDLERIRARLAGGAG